MLNQKISVIIPAYNEEKSIGKVVGDISRELVQHVIVVNNNSTDQTREVAEKAGAIVLDETRKGYGWACLMGIDKAYELDTDIIVFLDGDYSDYPDEIIDVVRSEERRVGKECRYGVVGEKLKKNEIRYGE